MSGPQTRDLPDVADTEMFGEELAQGLSAGDLVILDGPLGAGKTALARGIGRGLHVAGPVSSPTFIIAREHRPTSAGRPGMIHVDAYRLGGSKNSTHSTSTPTSPTPSWWSSGARGWPNVWPSDICWYVWSATPTPTCGTRVGNG